MLFRYEESDASGDDEDDDDEEGSEVDEEGGAPVPADSGNITASRRIVGLALLTNPVAPPAAKKRKTGPDTSQPAGANEEEDGDEGPEVVSDEGEEEPEEEYEEGDDDPEATAVKPASGSTPKKAAVTAEVEEPDEDED